MRITRSGRPVAGPVRGPRRRSALALVGAAAAALAVGLFPAAATAQVDESSRNWAGYIAGNAYYSGVSAVIQVPQVTDARRLGVISSWVGIGGVTSTDLIQAGVSATEFNGRSSYEAWVELLPAASRTINIQVHPGDLVMVDIHEVQPNLWQGTIVDGTQVFQRQAAYQSCHCSAEWIVEAPSLASGGIVPLAGASGASMSQMSAVANGVPSNPVQLSAQAVQMVGPLGRPKAVPTVLGPDGASFSVTTLAP